MLNVPSPRLFGATGWFALAGGTAALISWRLWGLILRRVGIS